MNNPNVSESSSQELKGYRPGQTLQLPPASLTVISWTVSGRKHGGAAYPDTEMKSMYNTTSNAQRHIYMVLSPRALPYARAGLKTLYRNALESFRLTLITDSQSDARQLQDEMHAVANGTQRNWNVADMTECDDRAADIFAGLPNIQAFRTGHPCWRKITDPLLFAEDGQEMILLDPDVYFPNQFTFEPTPAAGLRLMWQFPNCMVPDEVVRLAFLQSIRLAHHVDIGVSQWRQGVDLAWCDWLIGKLGGRSLPRVMHIEAIVWSALAMHLGGAHLNPTTWLCWRRSHWKRVLQKAGLPGSALLRFERLREAKCFHAGGDAKWWVEKAASAGLLDGRRSLTQDSECPPFVELTPRRYAREQSFKDALRSIGYYALVNPRG